MLRSPLSLLRASRLAAQAPRCARAASASAYKLHAHGDAASVLSLERGEVGAAAGDNLRVRWLAAGVDPLDLAAVRGDPAAAPFAPPLPAVPGSEGVAVVEEVGPDVTSVKPGDRVIPVKPAVGTWREAALVSEAQVLSVPSTIRVELAATLSGAFTALRLLSDFGALSAGDVVVQNDAASPVGTAVVQLARARGLRTVSLVDAAAPDYAPTVERLKLMGGDVVVGQAHAASPALAAVLADLPAPKLALNAGDAAACAALAGMVAEGGKVVTHSTGVAARGSATFSLAAWLDKSPRKDVETMVNTLTNMIEDGKLTGWLQRVKFEELPLAIGTGGMLRRKLVAMMPAAGTV